MGYCHLGIIVADQDESIIACSGMERDQEKTESWSLIANHMISDHSLFGLKIRKIETYREDIAII
jgi:hypothetical protein